MSNEVVITHNNVEYKMSEDDWSFILDNDLGSFIRGFIAITSATTKEASEIWEGYRNGTISPVFSVPRDLSDIIAELNARVREIGMIVEIIIK